MSGLHRFSNNKIVRAYCIALADYNKNSDTVNHAVVKMLYRITVQLKMAPLLYQISVFRTLNEILHEPTTTRYKVCKHCIDYTAIQSDIIQL